MDIKAKIQASGLKATPQRALVLEAMQELCHATIDELATYVQAKSPEITLSTIYRIIDSFCSLGLLSKLTQPGGKVLLDKNTSEHIHIFNSDLRVSDCFNNELMEYVKQQLAGQIGDREKIERISIQILTSNN